MPPNVNNIFSVLHINARSVLNKIDDLNIMFSKLKKVPDVLGISETWLSENNIQLANINGFKGYHLTRKRVLDHGGVTCFVRDSLDSELLEQFSFINDDIELCTVKIKVKEEYYLVSVVYRPSSKHRDVDKFTNILSKLLRNNTFKKHKHILLGDFNINLLDFACHPHTNQFLASMQNLKYTPLISRPTRFPDLNQRGANSLLDHLYINFTPVSISGILEYIISDHRPIFINISHPLGIDKNVKIKFRLINELNRQLFKRDLCNTHWEFLLTQEDFNTNFGLFFNKFSDLYNKHFPVMTRTLSNKHIINPWITPRLKQLTSNKSLLYKSYKNGHVSHVFYKNYCFHLNKLIKRTKNNYYHNVFSNFKSNIKKTWETLNKLTGKNSNKTTINNIIYNDKILNNPVDISEAFNTFFTNVATNLESKLPAPQTNPLQYLKGNFPHSMDNPHVDLNVIIKVIKSLPNKKSSINDFSPIILKENAHLIAQPLSQLFNESITAGKFPQILKTAQITPLYKKGPKHDMNNFRPISKLNIFSKIFEKTMKIFLVDFLDHNNIIHKSQYGFQKGKSTQHALLRFSNMVYESIQDGKSVLSLFVDFSKAFDTVPHSILINKLSHYGIRGKILEWFTDYLSNRYQLTIYEHHASKQTIVTSGVPQGSVLGPILFLIFINDLPSISENIFFSLFADDSCLSLCDNDIFALISNANREIDVFYNWCIANRTSINILKTFYLLFTNQSQAILPPVLIRNQYSYDVIKRVSHTKFLGVIYDDRLTFSNHISMLTNKLSRSSSLLYQLRDYLPINILKKLYYAHVYPYINYCNCIWSNTYQTHLLPLILIHKRIIRNIAKSDFLEHTEPLYKNLNILNVRNIRIMNLAIMMFKQVKNNEYALPILTQAHNYNTRYRENLLIPPHTTTLIALSFKVEGIKIWNNLPNDIKASSNINSFKKKLKSHLTNL